MNWWTEWWGEAEEGKNKKKNQVLKQILHTNEAIILQASVSSKYIKIMLQNVFSENQTKEIERKRQSSFFLFFYPPCCLIFSFHKVMWIKARLWRLGSPFIGWYFLWLPFPSLPSLLWPALTYYISNNATKWHYSGITHMSFLQQVVTRF